MSLRDSRSRHAQRGLQRTRRHSRGHTGKARDAVGGKIVARLEDGVLIIESREAALRRMRTMVAKYVDGGSIADELIAERRAEAEHE